MSGHERRNSLPTEVTDKQLTVFYVLLGFGCLAHEWNWWKKYIVEKGANLNNYLAGYREILPTVEFPFVAFLHLLFVVIALLLITNKRRPLWALLQWPTIVAMYFVQGMKPANHFFFLILVFTVHAIYWGLATYYRRQQDETSVGLNRNYFRLNLLILLCTTYFFAALFKVNPVFINPETSGAGQFIYPPLWPAHYGLKFFMGPGHVINDWMWHFYQVVGIASTYVFEFGLPVLFCMPRFRRVGLALGLLFHLVILSFSAIDFSMVVFAVYPFVLKGREVEDFLSQYVFRPSRGILITASIVGVYFCSVAVVFDLIHLPGWAWWIEVYRFAHIVAVAYLTFSMFRFARDGLQTNPRTGKAVFGAA